MARTQNTVFPGNTILAKQVIHQSFGDVSPETLFDLLQVAADPETGLDSLRLSQSALPIFMNSGIGLNQQVTNGPDVSLDQNSFAGVFSNTSGTTIDLPDASTVTGQIFYVKNGISASNNVLTAAGGTQGIDGQVTYQLVSEFDAVFVQAFNGAYYVIASNISPVTPSNVPQWFKVSKTYTDVSTGSTTNSITALTIAGSAFIHNAKIKASVAFTGGSISAVTASLGISGSLQQVLPNYDIHQSVSATTFAISGTADSFDNTSTTNILLTVNSTGGNLSTLTAGTLDIWLLISQAA